MLRNAAEGAFDGVWVRHDDDGSACSVGEGAREDAGDAGAGASLRRCTGTYTADDEPAELESDAAAASE